MSNINRHPVRRTAAGVLAGALALSGAVAVATPASALPGFSLERIAGENRYETSARVAAEFGVTSGAILASGETGHVVDALSANFLAGVRGVPVLLTTRNSIPDSVMARLNALTGEKRVTIVGETAAVSSAVETRLRGMGFQVDRLGGADRFATSEEIIKAGATAANPIGLIASGTSFPDALAGGPLAYKGKHPVFLTSGGGLPQDTIDALVAAGTRQVIILGGTSAVPASVETELAARGITVVRRLGGAGRSETSRIIADYLIAEQGFTNTTFNVASGVPRGEGADALTGAALSGKQNRALLITDNVTSGNPVVNFARDRAATLNAVGNIFGGPAAVAVALEEAIEAAGRGTGSGPVTLTSSSVAQGGALTGTIIGDFSSVTVSGCGFTNQTVGADDNSTTAGRQFTLNVAGDQATGNCTLTFTATPTGGGAAVTQTVPVNVTAGGLRVTPDETVTLQAVANPDTATTDNRTYTAFGLTAGVEYRATLVLAGNVTTNAQGQSVFADADNDNLADTGNPTADITQVNGAAPNNNTGRGSTSTATGGTTSSVVFTAQADGTATFVVDGDQAESVRPVVYVNGGGTSDGTPGQGGTSPRLELDANNVPTGAFDLGGITIFTAPAVGAGVTARPELVSAAVVSTTTETQQSSSNAIGTRVRYTFDEAVTGTTASFGRFFVTTANGGRTAATEVTIEAGGTTVLARFAGINTAAGAAALTVATVDDSAVTDGQGNVNPEGDAAIGTGGTTTGGAAGVTTAPDLVSVGNFREGAVDGTTAVDFAFDEAAFVVNAAGFSLIMTDGTERACAGPVVGSTTPASGGTSAGGNGTTVITVVCEDVTGQGPGNASAGTTTLTAANVARGSVASGSVRDGAIGTANTDSDNPLQTVDVSNGGNTTRPDLVSAEFRPGATATDADAVLFTFDEAVQVGTTANTAPGPVPTLFRVYDDSGNEVGGTGSAATSAVRNPNNDRQVLVTFGTTAVDNAVGASVLDGAVTAATGAATATNQQDEAGVANATQTVTVSGRTTGPDLTGVALSAAGTDSFTNATNAFRATYTFDEAVSAATASRFFLYTAEGNRLTSTNCEVGSATNTGTSTVRCTDFTGVAANQGQISGAAVGNAVLGTVDAFAVIAVDGTPSNPEGAEPTSGGTGTANSAPTAVGSAITPTTTPTATTGTTTTPTALTAAGTTNDANNNDTFDAGEASTITFSRALNPTGVGTASTTLNFRDVDGTTGQIVCASDCVLSVNNTVLTIPNGGLPVATGGSATGFQGPLSVTATTGLRSANDNTPVSVPFTITV